MHKATLSDRERQEAERRIREELEAEHRRRIERLRERQRRARRKAKERVAEKREIELGRLKEDLTKAFYAEKGYRLYTDSTGRTMWIPPEEYEWRLRHRRRRRRRSPGSWLLVQLDASRREWVTYLLLLLLAGVAGLLLAR